MAVILSNNQSPQFHSIRSPQRFLKAKWRAAYARHMLHIPKHASVLVVGTDAGQSAHALRAIFSKQIRPEACEQLTALPAGTYDYVLGAWEQGAPAPTELLAQLTPRLKKGGGIALFLPRNTRRLWPEEPAHYRDIHFQPFDLIPNSLSPRLIKTLDALAFLLAHSPFGSALAGSYAVTGYKEGTLSAARAKFAPVLLRNEVSVVVPCHNEAMNIERLVRKLTEHYSDYFREIILVDDNSSDGTAEAIKKVAEKDPRVKLIKRTPPNGVGRALRDGYKAAQGKFILSMDCDFVEMLPEIEELFEAVANGYDGAIGSRFTYESVMVGYPFTKMLCNRTFHFLLRLLIKRKVRDLTNNLKLYRTEILKALDITEPHFAANLETGLKPLLQGYNVVEVPVPWINRRPDMGVSSFRTLRVGPPYTVTLARALLQTR